MYCNMEAGLSERLLRIWGVGGSLIGGGRTSDCE